MSNQNDVKIINNTPDEKTVKADLNAVDIPGVIYWRGIFMERFSKTQLMKIIYLLMEFK